MDAGLILSTIAYLFQIVCTLLAAAFITIPVLAVMALCKVDLTKRRLLCIFVIILLLICMLLAFLCMNPIIHCPEEYSALFTDELSRSVKTVANGFYSARLPLIPCYVDVCSILWSDYLGEYEIKFDVYYLYFGSVRTVIGDGISVIRPLSGL